MPWESKDIYKDLNDFCESRQFKTFEKIMDDISRAKFLQIQSNPDGMSHADLIAERKVLNMYMNLPNELKSRLAIMRKNKEIEKERE
jgi:hypothetical protein